MSKPLHIVWEGAFLARHSLARVNRELVTALHRLYPDWQFYLVPHVTDDGALQGDTRWAFVVDRLRRLPSHADVWIRHHWPPNWQRPAADRFIVIQPWEFGSVPREWVEAINRNVDELWVPSSFVRDCYVRDGVDAQKVHVVPNGVSEVFFEPTDPFPLPTQKRFRFLFVGGTIPRKGIDILLDGYTRTFTRDDDVSLVIKDFGANTFYRGQHFAEQIRWFQQQPEAPEIVYIPEELDEAQMNALYRACHALVHPYRGEGFGLPIAEAMACGLPVIVTGFGAALDFCNEQRAFLIPASVEHFADNLIDSWETVNLPFWAKPDRNAMEALMEQVYRDSKVAKAKAERAAQWVRENLTWRHAAQAAAKRLLEEAAQPALPEGALRRASQLVRDGRYTEAIALLEQLVQREPQHLKAYSGLGVAYYQSGSIARAEGVLRQGLQQGEDFELHHHLADILRRTGRSQEALQHAVRAVELNPGGEESLRLLRELYSRLQRRAKKRPSSQLQRWLERASRLLSGLEKGCSSPVTVTTSSQGKRPRLSLCMIAKNEEEFIEGCLQSVQGLVDEIVVVDTGSTDRTVEIAKRYGAKVVHHPWRDDFSDARNVSIQHATGDWGLWLDADERLDRASAEAIRRAICDYSFGGYLLEIHNEMGDSPEDGVFIHRACRVFRLLPGTRFEGRVHEQVMPSLERQGYEVAFLKGAVIRHLGYRSRVVQQRNKNERAIRLLQMELQQDPDNLFQRFNLANAYYVVGDYPKVIAELEPIVDRIEPGQDHAGVAYVLLANALQTQGRHEEVLATHQRALARGVDHPGLYFADGYAYLALRRYEEAVQAFHRTLETYRGEHITGDATIAGFKAYYGLAQAYLGTGNLEESERYCRLSLQERSQTTEAHYLLSQILFQRGDFEQGLKHLEQAYSYAPQNLEVARELALRYEQAGRWVDAYTIWRRLVNEMQNQPEWRWHSAQCAEKLGLWQEAQADYTELTIVQPEFAPVWVNLGRVHLAQGDIEGALACFTRAIELAPEDANAFFNAGDALYQLGAYEAAVETYTAALQRDPTNAQGFFTLGNAFYQMGAYESAMMAYQQALTLQPDHAAARHNLELVREQMKERVA
ncbi:MAG: tetratricopeptide repeat protein [bacterium]|nr:tetratricopeptide repeat protein [bacterium]